MQRQQELTHEERISLGFLDHQTSQRGQLGSVGLERIGEEPGDVGQAKRRERQRRHGAAAIADATQRQRQGMHRVHFVVAIRPDEEKAADPVVGENDAKQSERGGVGPLQIVEKEDDDPLARAEGARIVDVDGREYIDFAGGLACQNLGHGFPPAVAAIHVMVSIIPKRIKSEIPEDV